MVQDRAIFTMADQWKVACGLSNGAIFNDLERPSPNLVFNMADGIPTPCNVTVTSLNKKLTGKINTLRQQMNK